MAAAAPTTAAVSATTVNVTTGAYTGTMNMPSTAPLTVSEENASCHMADDDVAAHTDVWYNSDDNAHSIDISTTVASNVIIESESSMGNLCADADVYNAVEDSQHQKYCDDQEEEEEEDNDNEGEDEECESIDVCGSGGVVEPLSSSSEHKLVSSGSGPAFTTTGNKRQPGGVRNNRVAASAGTKRPSIRGGRGVGRPRGSRGHGRGGRGRGYLPPAVAEGLARHEAVQQRVYRSKYRQMKNITRSLLLENAALCDQVAEVQQRIILANEERRALLRRLQTSMQAAGHTKDSPFQQLDPAAWSQLEARGNPDTSTPTPTTTSSNSSRGSGTNPTNQDTGSGAQPPAKRARGQQNGRSRGGSGSSKSKRLCPPITLDSAGRPIFPICLGPLTIHSLGEIVCERPAYHRQHVIYPVGFCSSRTYGSVTRPSQPATYTCKILDAGPVPRFEVVCEDPDSGEERVFSGSSPSDCHNQVVAAINSTQQVPRGILTPSTESNSISDRGLRFFGLSHPSVQNVLQACPGARKCHHYHWIKFEVCRSEAEVEKVLEAELDPGFCHLTLLRSIRLTSQAS